MHARLACGSMLRSSKAVLSTRSPMIEVVGVAIEIVCSAVEVVCGAIEMVAIDDRCAVRDVGVVIVNDGPMAPVASPVVPSPPVACEETNSKPQAKGNAGARGIQSWIGVPARPHRDGSTVN